MTISKLQVGKTRVVRALRLPDHEASWLRAVGLYEGVAVTPLRFGPLGGPVHLRTSTGAELAIDLELARAIDLGDVVDAAPSGPDLVAPVLSPGGVP
jgi:Fe2+ transport system protein FeoA